MSTLIQRIDALGFAERIPVIQEAVSIGGLDPATRAKVWRRWVHALRSLKQVSESVTVAAQALNELSAPADRFWMLVYQGLGQSDLGNISGLREVVDAMGQDIDGQGHEPIVLAFALMLRGRLLLHTLDPAAIGPIERAIATFADLGYDQDEAWGQLSIGRFYLRLRDPESAIGWATRVRYVPYMPKAQLQVAEAHIQLVDVPCAKVLVSSVLEARYGTPDDVDNARAIYLNAEMAALAGESDRALVLVQEASNLALAAKPRDVILIDQINELRGRAVA